MDFGLDASDPGHKLYDAAADGNTEDVRRLLAEKEPLEYKNVRHCPPRSYTLSRTHTRSLLLAAG